ncbi:MDR family oxidoreductase [Rheinheimera tangshanensis]|uniref:Oxidoreductase n=1 Tax=Rheinheimera tangshanensis TaxID=400153 RepID=A0A5C8LKN2_9GAMM|nr:MDR family oxidoreductase [Rheinheimera tangshanensis]TXK77911.1 oxidoreductase [Rheinheimera tangshanensis]GGM44019.1 alcohol dehydrogenase [Rheinheimera tangshanensis]
MFNGILIRKDEQGYRAELTALDEQQLPAGDVTVKVLASTLNYKDALAITGQSPVVRSFPMVPGIDLVAEVLHSDSARFQSGDKVLLNGFGVGESHWGGLAEKARLNSDWLLPLPEAFTAEQAMAIGTAGYTAMLCILALQKHGITTAHGEILVTGANGGVGSYAVLLLNKLGYKVVASTGRPDESHYLTQLGAAEILPREQLSVAGKPLQKERWAGVVDCVGSHTLANACASTRYGGAVTACGLAQGMDFPVSVAPFILRGVTLYGIDSVMRPLADRMEAWQRLSELLLPDNINQIAQVISLDQVITTAAQLLQGTVRGRVIVKI